MIAIILKQVVLPAAWGVASGLLCDKSPWNSPRFLAVAAATLWAAIAAECATCLIAWAPCFVIGSRLRVVGLTGGIATGKSSVSRRFLERGIPVVDADKISHSILKHGMPVHRKVVEAFKSYPGIVKPDGNIDRAELRKLVFSDQSCNRVLKQLTHPAIRNEMLKQIAQLSIWEGHPLVVLDSPLLFESGSAILCKRVMVVHCDKETQIARVMERDGCTKRESEAAIMNQMPQEAKLVRADVKLPNNSDLETLRGRVDAGVDELVAESTRHATRAWMRFRAPAPMMTPPSAKGDAYA